jgi:hypothetical protein
MSGPNLKPSQRVAVLGVIAPVSSVAAVSTAWVDASKFQNLMALIQLGVLGAAATVDAKLQQATDAAGTGVKDIAGKSIAQFLKATPDDGKQAIINFKQDDLDVNGGFGFVRLTMTQAVAASLVAGVLLGFDARYGPADGSAAATQAQIVG